MEPIKLKVERRAKTGARSAGAVRRSGLIPSIVYAKGGEAHPISLVSHEFINAASKARPSQVFAFESPDSEINGRQGIVRDIQRDYARDKILHIDFQLLKDNEAIKLKIPLKISGDSIGVKNEGGVLEIIDRYLLVRCMPNSIPLEIPIDISALDLGDVIKAKDIELPSGVTLAAHPDESIVSIVASRTSQMLTQATEELAAAAAAAVPGAPGEAAAAVPGAEGAVEPAEGEAAAAPEGKETAKK